MGRRNRSLDLLFARMTGAHPDCPESHPTTGRSCIHGSGVAHRGDHVDAQGASWTTKEALEGGLWRKEGAA